MKQPQQMGSMADFSAFPFVQQAQQSVEIWYITEIKEVSYARSGSTQTCLASLKMKQGLELLVAHFFYLSIV